MYIFIIRLMDENLKINFNATFSIDNDYRYFSEPKCKTIFQILETFSSLGDLTTNLCTYRI